MLGFIKKDLAMIKSNFKILAILFILYAIMGFSGEMDISFILPFISVMLMLTTFSYDSFNKWDAYCVTLPDGRKNSVKAKYVATLVMILIITVITTILSILISYYNSKNVDFEIILLSMFANIFGTLIVLSFMYPIIYKLGIEKARISIFIIVFGIAIFGGFILNFIDISSILNTISFLQNYWKEIIIILEVLMLYFSYKISLEINLNKEF